MAANFPKWLTRDKKGAFVVNTQEVYPVVLKALGMKPDQYSIEVAYQSIKMKVQDLVAASGDDPRDAGKPLVILMDAGKDKDKWALASHPTGKGAAVATKGREARTHYERIRHAF